MSLSWVICSVSVWFATLHMQFLMQAFLQACVHLLILVSCPDPLRVFFCFFFGVCVCVFYRWVQRVGK